MSSSPEKSARMELVGAANAPTIVFDSVSLFGTLAGGTGRLTLDVLIQDEGPNGEPIQKRLVVAHLRGNDLALRSLREALDGIELMMVGSAKPEGPAN